MKVSISRSGVHFVTPDAFGAIEGEEADNSEALAYAFDSKYPVMLNRNYRYAANEDLTFYPELGQSVLGCHPAISGIISDRSDGGDLLVPNRHGGNQFVKVQSNLQIKNISLIKKDGDTAGALLNIKSGSWHSEIDFVRFTSPTKPDNTLFASGIYQHGLGLNQAVKFDCSEGGMFYTGFSGCQFIGLHRSVEVVNSSEPGEKFGRPNEITFDRCSWKEGYNGIYIPWLYEGEEEDYDYGVGGNGWRVENSSFENMTGAHIYGRSVNGFSVDARFEDTVLKSWQKSDGSADTRTPIVFGDECVYCTVDPSSCFKPMAVNDVYHNSGTHGGWYSSFANRVHRERYLADDDSMLFMIRDNGQVLSQPKQTEIAYANIVEPDILFGGDTFTLSANGNVRFDRPINFENSPQINIEVEALFNCELRFKKSDYGVTALDFDVTGNSVFSFVSLTAGQVATISFRYSEKQGIFLQTSNLQII